MRYLALISALLMSMPAFAAAPPVPISNLPSGGSVQAGDLFPATRNGVTYGVTYQGTSTISALTSATAPNTINNAGYNQIWNWSGLESSTGLSIVGGALTTGTALNVTVSGSANTGYAGYFANPSSLGYGLYVQGNAGLGTVTTGTWQGSVIQPSYLAVSTSSAPGIVQPDNVTTTISGGVISAVGANAQYEQLVSSGLSATTTNVSTQVYWNVATAGVKTDTIPAATGSKKYIWITDVAGTAGNTNNYIQAVPVSGNILGNSYCYTNNCSITLFDSEVLTAWVSE